MKTLVKVSIPERLRDGMFLKTATHFAVPASMDGYAFMDWWEKAASDDRDEVMKVAYEKDIGVVEALKEKLASCAS